VKVDVSSVRAASTDRKWQPVRLQQALCEYVCETVNICREDSSAFAAVGYNCNSIRHPAYCLSERLERYLILSFEWSQLNDFFFVFSTHTIDTHRQMALLKKQFEEAEALETTNTQRAEELFSDIVFKQGISMNF
jgi:hypothetical protein